MSPCKSNVDWNRLESERLMVESGKENDQEVNHLTIESKWNLFLAFCFTVLFYNLLVAVYITIGIGLLLNFFCIQYCSSDKPVSWWDKTAFAFATVSTIGYGNVVPANDANSKLLIFLYSCIGIQLYSVAVNSNGILVQSLYYVVRNKYSPNHFDADIKFEWWINVALFFSHCFFGTIIFHCWINKTGLVDAFYISYISTSTIGYGDILPNPKVPFEYVVVKLYLYSGHIILALLTSSLQDIASKFQFWIQKKLVPGVEESFETLFQGQTVNRKVLVELFPTYCIMVVFYNLLLAAYTAGILLLSEFLHLRYSSSVQPVSQCDTIFFAMATLSTIGYGNVVPADDAKSKIVLILYSFFGIQLFSYVMTSNRILLQSLCHIMRHESSSKPVNADTTFKLWINVVFFFSICALGTAIFSCWINKIDYMNAFHISYISISTIGYGDFLPNPESPLQYVVVKLFLYVGLIVTFLLSTSIQNVALNFQFWIQKKLLTSSLTRVMAEKLGSSPKNFEKMMDERNNIMEMLRKQSNCAKNDEEESGILRNTEYTVPHSEFRKIREASSDCHGTTLLSPTLDEKRAPKDTDLAIATFGTILDHLRKLTSRIQFRQRSKTYVQYCQNSMDNTNTKITTVDFGTADQRHRKGHLLR